MDVNLIVVNVGNSRVAIGVFVDGEMEQVVRIPHDRSVGTQSAGLFDALHEAWARIKGKEDPRVIGACVKPVLIEQMEHAVMEATGEVIQWVGRQIELPIKVLTEAPTDTGVDRVLGIAAAYEQLGKACVVVDAGTAITVNLCSDKGEFLGGAIAPGAQMQLDALNEKTAKLPVVEFAVPESIVGHSTRQAMLHGVYHGIRGMVKELVENYATRLESWPEVIATGGDAKLLFEDWELIHAVSPDLVMYGIALAYTSHLIKEDE